MAGTLRPQTPDDLAGAITWAVGEKAPVEIIGTGTKRGIGRAMQTSVTLDLSALSGVSSMSPTSWS
jgi:glycolate oxidase FAD binding subunit